MPFDFRPVFDRAQKYAPFLEQFATPDQRQRWKSVYDSVKLSPDQLNTLSSFRRQMLVICMAGPWCGDCVAACPIFQKIAEACPLIDLRFINRVQNFDINQPPQPYKPGTTEDPDDIRSKPIGKILVKWGILTPERIEKALLEQEDRKARGLNAKIGDVMTDLGMITAGQRDQALAAQQGFADLAQWDHAVAKELMTCGAPRVPMLVFLSEDGYECGRFGERTLTTYRQKAARQLANTAGASCPTGLFADPADILNANIAEWFGHFERIQWMLLTSPRLMKRHGEA